VLEKTIAMARILVIEDDPQMRESFVELLSGAGHTVYCATTPEKAIEIEEERGLDLVIANLRMPGGAGMESIVTLQYTRPDLKVITVSPTSGYRGSLLDVAEALGAERTFVQPYDLKQLLEAFNELLT
jgi:DNA-binding NtrC family response regulator